MTNFDYTKHIQEAENTATSGRWAMVAECIQHRAHNPKSTEEMWYWRLFSSLVIRLLSDYNSLRASYDSSLPDAALMAWRARNILELWVWAKFCDADLNNAKRLFDDQDPDTRNLMASFERWSTRTGIVPEGWPERMKDLRGVLDDRAAASGIAGDGHYTSVADAAEAVGVKDHFALVNKVCSKFAHPTSILLTVDQKMLTNQIKDMMLGIGSAFFVQTLNCLERIAKAGVV